MSDRVYIPLHAIARVCVMTEHTLLTRFWPAQWGVPGDWGMVRSAVIVNQASLPALVTELAENGQPGTAEMLKKWCEENAAEPRETHAEFVAAHTAQSPENWAHRWEAEQG